jgi:hypothetical protein
MSLTLPAIPEFYTEWDEWAKVMKAVLLSLRLWQVPLALFKLASHLLLVELRTAKRIEQVRTDDGTFVLHTSRSTLWQLP